MVLAEDEDDLREVLAEVLAEAGMRVIAVRDVASLRTVLAGVTPHVLLTDFHLGSTTVEDVLSDVVAEARVEHVHVLSASPLARIAAVRLGLPFMSKPFDLDEFVALACGDSRTTAA
ncbi:MAG: hypothetical protein HYV09_23440 [Deltaproteobacteria bacterium]|nr:hypothetical protein [Deltaproteobacteria bacterium]